MRALAARTTGAASLVLLLAAAAVAQQPGPPAVAGQPAADAGAAAAADGGAMAAADGGPSDAGVPDAGAPVAPPPTPGLTPERLASIQAALQAAKIDAWLLTDFRRSDPVSLRVLGLETEGWGSRRWFCLVPARGQPQKLLHAIEPRVLDLVPGQASTYASWRSRDRELARLVRAYRQVAMNWSPRNEIPTASRTDGGTVELVRSLGVEVVSSAELIAQIESTLTPDELASQARAASLLAAVLDGTAQEAARRLKAGSPATERELQDFAIQQMANSGLTTDRPIVAVDANTASPHYGAPEKGSAVAGQNSVLLLDMVARVASDPKPIAADLTRVYFLGERTPDQVARTAQVVFKARDAALDLLRNAAEFGRPITGAQVDAAARKVITDAGHGERFPHRTGHSIGQRAHGDGVNNDDFETHDVRRHLPNTCFSIEPGIYLPGRFGIRTEVDVCLVKDASGKLQVDVRGGPPQSAVPALLAP